MEAMKIFDFKIGPGSSPAKVEPQPKNNPGHLQRVVGMSVEVTSFLVENILSYPCLVLRRRCQANGRSARDHVVPFTIFAVLYRLQRQGCCTSLFKGLGTSLLVKGVSAGTESLIGAVASVPGEIDAGSGWRDIASHLLLKGFVLALATPIHAATVVESVQSSVMSEGNSILECVYSGLSQMSVWSASNATRFIPIWSLLIPTAAFGLMHYGVCTLSRHLVLRRMKKTGEDNKRGGTFYGAFYPELVAASVGSLVANVSLYPFETVLTRLYVQGTRTLADDMGTGEGVVPILTRYEGVFDCFSTVMTQEGIGGFYKGFGALIVQCGVHLMVLMSFKYVLDRLSDRSKSPAEAPKMKLDLPF